MRANYTREELQELAEYFRLRLLEDEHRVRQAERALIEAKAHLHIAKVIVAGHERALAEAEQT